MKTRHLLVFHLSLLASLFGTVVTAQPPDSPDLKKDKGEESEFSKSVRALLSLVVVVNQTETLLKESKEKGAGELLNLVKDFEKELNSDIGEKERTKVDKDAKAPVRIDSVEEDKQKFRRLTLSDKLLKDYLEGSQYIMSLFVREIVRTDELGRGKKDEDALKASVLAQANFLKIAQAKRKTSDKRVEEILEAKKKGEDSTEFKAAIENAKAGKYEARTGEFKKEFNENLDEVDGLLRKAGIRLIKEKEKEKP